MWEKSDQNLNQKDFIDPQGAIKSVCVCPDVWRVERQDYFQMMKSETLDGWLIHLEPEAGR